MLRHAFQKHTLQFKRPGGTSRGVLKTKDSWILKIWEEGNANVFGLGECSIIERLSPDPIDQIEMVLTNMDLMDLSVNRLPISELGDFPAIHFAVETALMDLNNGGKRIVCPSPFTQEKSCIPINGLIWMGDISFMKDQIREKLALGFRCLKLKIGATEFDSEIDLLQKIRSEYPIEDLELRVDANGAFEYSNALEKLKRLNELDLHSIEQPIRHGQIEEMAYLCENSPLDIALDEELIGIRESQKRITLLKTIRPQYIILKPSLVGGMCHAADWIQIAESYDIQWWVTSALESNIGLNAIAQWTATLSTNMFQGLGTGQLFTNNFDAPLELNGDELWYRQEKDWNYLGLNI
ncbi:MAG: o-succinylbenzoate synthase [Bacteroidia bacterium]|nr:o-succinylbenzoate synthase [Bacteroidia bacterium]